MLRPYKGKRKTPEGFIAQGTRDGEEYIASLRNDGFERGRQRRAQHAAPLQRQRKGLGPVGAVEGAVLDGFAEVFGFDGGGGFEVGDGACDF